MRQFHRVASETTMCETTAPSSLRGAGRWDHIPVILPRWKLCDVNHALHPSALPFHRSPARAPLTASPSRDPSPREIPLRALALTAAPARSPTPSRHCRLISLPVAPRRRLSRRADEPSPLSSPSRVEATLAHRKLPEEERPNPVGVGRS
jgi:hypothetical protein